MHSGSPVVAPWAHHLAYSHFQTETDSINVFTGELSLYLIPENLPSNPVPRGDHHESLSAITPAGVVC